MLREQLLRDEFAKAALTGLASSLRPGTVFNIDIIARQAYELADAMVRQSKVPHKTMEEIAAEYAARKNGTVNRDNCAPSNNPEIECQPGITAAAARLRHMNDVLEENDRLREAIRRLADQDATLSVVGGNVTVMMDATLTDEEREAVEWSINDQIEGGHQEHPAVKEVIAVLRGLLARTKE